MKTRLHILLVLRARLLRATVLISLLAFWQPAARPLESAPTGLVAAYGFNEASGPQLFDASGNGNTGTISGAAWIASGRFGGALSFDGVNDWVTIDDASALDLTGGMTLSAWVYPTALSGWRSVILKERVAGLSYALYAHDNDPHPAVTAVVAGSYGSALGTSPLALDTWTHLAATYDGAMLRLFINGVQVGSRTLTGSLVTSGNPLRIGGNSIWGEYFRGRIDEIRIYNRPLTSSEIQADLSTAVTADTADTTPPVITNVATSAVTESGAAISWVTDEPADSQVEYGTTASYGSITTVNAALVTSHSVSLSGLNAGTLYHYRVKSKDGAGNLAVSVDQTFTTTAPSTTQPKLIISSPSSNASIVGTSVDVAYTTTGDLAAVDHVHFKLDANPEVMDMTFDGAHQLSNVPAGSHVLNGYLARSDHSKINGSDASPVSFNTSVPDTVTPAVSITSPPNGATVSGTITVTVDASDNVGVVGVQFLLDGNVLGAEDTTVPYGVSWNTSTASPGSYTLTARVRDAAANQTTSSPVVVTVSSPTDPSQVGEWSPPIDWPLVTVHATLLPSSEVLVWDGWEQNAFARIWNPISQTFSGAPNLSGLFCSGHSFFADGRLLVTGGHAGAEIGIVDTNIFDPATKTWTKAADMAFARWYPSNVTLADGRVLTFSGQITPGVFADTPEIFDPVTAKWSSVAVNTGSMHENEYPLTYLLPNGNIFAIGPTPGVAGSLDLSVPRWTHHGAIPMQRGSSVMYRPGQILYLGGGNGAANDGAQPRAWAIDGNQSSPQWREVASMQYGRYQHNVVMLPDGTVFAVGGSTVLSQTAGPAALAPEIWDPNTDQWTTMAAMHDPRLYHSTALLLADGRVLVAGGGRFSPAADYFTAEIYSPPYLFKGPRPTITSAPAQFSYGASTVIQTPDAADIASVSLMRLGSTTHTFDMNQNYVPVTFTAGTNTLTIQVPGSANIAPPGHYMLFLVNGNGVPSVGTIVRLPSPTGDTQPPSAPTGLTASGSTGAANLLWTAATDDTGVSHYDVHRSTTAEFTPGSGNLVGQAPSTSYTDAEPVPGTYFYRVVARDPAGNVSPPSNEASATISADLSPPEVAITAPAGGATVFGAINVTASASDNVGVAGVEFLLDGVMLGVEDTAAPYSVSWNTTAATNGVHTLGARARDAAGNDAISSVTVTVSNSASAGLVAAYGFNEGSGTTTADTTVRNNNGTSSGATWSTQGRFGSALSFDGVNDWVTVADSDSLDLTTGMTVEAWVKPSALSGWRTALIKEISGGLSYALYAHDNLPHPAVTIVTTNGDGSAIGASQLPVGTWTHLAGTYDGATLRLFVNGIQIGSRTLPGEMQPSSSPLRIGGNAVWGEYFAGLIDEVRIYNRALSPAEIQTDMNTPVE